MERSSHRSVNSMLRKAPAWVIRELAERAAFLEIEGPTAAGVPTHKLTGKARRYAEEIDRQHATESATERVRRVAASIAAERRGRRR